MRKRVSLYIYENGRLLVFKRIREDRIHYVAIGGGVELGETIAESKPHREAKEETNYDIVLGPQLWAQPLNDEQYEYAYLVTEFSGKLALGGPELARQTPTNQHIFEWVALVDLPTLDLYPGPITPEDVQLIRQALP